MCIAKAAEYIEEIQASDGSWFAFTLFFSFTLMFEFICIRIYV